MKMDIKGMTFELTAHHVIVRAEVIGVGIYTVLFIVNEGAWSVDGPEAALNERVLACVRSMLGALVSEMLSEEKKTSEPQAQGATEG